MWPKIVLLPIPNKSKRYFRYGLILLKSVIYWRQLNRESKKGMRTLGSTTLFALGATALPFHSEGVLISNQNH